MEIILKEKVQNIHHSQFVNCSIILIMISCTHLCGATLHFAVFLYLCDLYEVCTLSEGVCILSVSTNVILMKQKYRGVLNTHIFNKKYM